MGTKVSYDDAHAYEVFSQRLFFIKSAPVLKTAEDITFDQKSPVNYTGSVNNAEGPHTLVFSESYSPYWSLRLYDSSRKPLPINTVHFSVNSYANAWFVPSSVDKYSFELSYTPQTLRNIGLVVSVVTFSLVTALFFLKK